MEKRYSTRQEPGGEIPHMAHRISLQNSIISSIDDWMEFHRARNVTSHRYGHLAPGAKGLQGRIPTSTCW